MKGGDDGRWNMVLVERTAYAKDLWQEGTKLQKRGSWSSKSKGHVVEDSAGVMERATPGRASKVTLSRFYFSHTQWEVTEVF